MKTHRLPYMRRGALALAAVLACAGAAAQPRTTLQVMPSAGAAAPAQAFGLSDAGVVVGSQTVAGGASQPFVWQGQNLPAEGLGMPGSALGVGNGGTVVGSAVFTGTGLRAFSWTSSGGLQNLGVLPGGGMSFATGVDDAGRITGLSQTGGSSSRAFLLEPGGAMRELGTLGGSTSQGQAIANGRVVGASTDASGALQAFSWTEAGGMLGIGPIAEVSEARGVNRAGLVVGRAVVAGEDLPFLWTPGDRARLFAGAEGFHGAAVNDAGQVLLRHSAGGNSMLWVEGGMPAKLQTLAGAGVSNFDATAINGFAQVAGTATGSATGGVARPVLLTLHPEWQGGSGRWDSAGGAHWNWAGTGVAAATVGAMHDVVIDPDVDATVTAATTVSRSLRVGGRGTRAIVLDMAGTNRIFGPAVIADGGMLTGYGTLQAQSITIAERGEVVAPTTITLDGSLAVSNAGTVRFGQAQSGNAFFRANLPAGLTNLAHGRVEVTNATVAYDQYLSNDGVWKWSGDTRMVTEGFYTGYNNSAGGLLVYGPGRHETYSFHGALRNSGRIELAPGAAWDLDMDLYSAGTLDIAAGAVLATAFIRQTVLAGATGGGRIDMRGELRPYASSGVVRIEPTLVMHGSSRVTLRLGGTVPGSGDGHHEKFILDRPVELIAGWLDVQLAGGYQPQAGDVYDLFDWNGGVSGSFARQLLPTLADGLASDTTDLYAGGTLSITAVPEPGPAALLLAGLATLGGRLRCRAVPRRDHA